MRYLFTLFFLCSFAAYGQVLSISVSHTDLACNGQPDGTATVTATNGTPPYNYLWLPGTQSTATITGLSAATYTCIVWDAAADTLTDVVTVGEPSALNPGFSQTNLFCNGAHNGIATVLAGGGTPPYSYSWSPTGGNGANATGLSGGSYTCVLTDANGCNTSLAFNITEPPPIVATVLFEDIKCHGDSTGTASVFVSGGTPPYTYTWAPGGDTTSAISGMHAGVYTCTITDHNFCKHREEVTISNISAIKIVDSQSNLLCYNDSTGYAEVRPSGGTGSYSYSWSPAVSWAASASILKAGTYICTVTDANNCQRKDTFLITQPSELKMARASKRNVICAGKFDAYIIVSDTGGTLPYTYTWTPPNVNDTIIRDLAPNTYSCIVTDSNGCKTDTSFTIVDTSGLFSHTVSSEDVGCRSAKLFVHSDKGSRPVMEYDWIFNSADSENGNPLIHTFPHDSPNTAMAVVIDSVGCRDTVVFDVNIHYHIYADFTHTPDTNSPNRAVTFVNRSTDYASIFSWDFGDGTYSTEENPLKLFLDSTVFHVCLIAADTNNCADTLCKDVLIDADKVIGVPTAFSPNGDGMNDILYVRGFRISSFHMKIFNRWGEKLFETDNKDRGWDGRYKGVIQPAESYGYSLDVQYTDGTAEQKTGSFSLLK